MTRSLMTGLVLLGCLWRAPVLADELDASRADFRAIYKQLVEINTTLSSGSCTEAANAMAHRLRTAGIASQNIQVIVPPGWPQQGNLIAALPGLDPDAKAVLLLAHLDVVEANREDWERDPFTLVEEDGYFYGRGTMDDKAMAAVFVDILVRMKTSGYRPERTVKLALTCGEETPNTFNGAHYLVEHHRDLLDAGFALNEGTMGILSPEGTPVYNGVQAGEKTYQDFRLEVRNPGGHSSRPVKDNAIYRLATALRRIADHEFVVEFNDTTRAYFQRLAGMAPQEQAADLLAILQEPPAPEALARVLADPSFNAILRTTCVATQLSAGHAPNALPQRATANVNCRIFPGREQAAIRRELEQVIGDPDVVVSFADPPETTSPPPALTAEILGPIEQISGEMWPGVPVLPHLQAGGTDGRFLTPAGIPTYGVNGLFVQPERVRAHGLNEGIPVESLYRGREFLDRLVKRYVGGE